jgi:hypothetical protein
MLFTLDRQLCYELAGVSDAASTDVTRPALRAVNIGVAQTGSKFSIRAVATDSYMLALREITVDTAVRENAAFADDSDDKLEPFSVSARDWKKALKDAAMAKSMRDSILIDVTEDGITIAAEYGDSPEVTLRPQDDFTYPKYEALMGERVVDGELILPAFNATLLRRMESALSAKPADRSTFPVRFAATKSGPGRGHGTSDMRPWSFLSYHDEPWYHSEINVIVMPTRVADAA